jgi:hypothetical protein
MFCNQCGGELQYDFRVCPRCGKPLQANQSAPSARFQSHLRTLGVLWMIVGAITLIPAFVLMSLSSLHVVPPFPEEVAHVLGPLSPLLFMIIGSIFLFIGAAELLVGWGLMQRQPWARTGAIVVGVLALIHPPFGTLLGIYTLWVLLSRNADVEYQAIARAA